MRYTPYLLLLAVACEGRDRSALLVSAAFERQPTLGARSGHAMTCDAGALWIFGGTPGDDFVRWADGRAERRGSTEAPATRVGHAMVFDPVRRVHVLFGGADASAAALRDTWEFDGVNWRQLQPAAAPSGRFFHQMAFDPVTRRVILFGGSNGLGEFADTWAWDGTRWLDASRGGLGNPGARVGHAMATYGGNGIMLHGGTSRSGLLDDLWLFDGAVWRRFQGLGSPPARAGHTLTQLDDVNSLLLFGGRGSGGDLGDTWILGNGWRQVTGSAPAARRQHACCFAGNGSVLLAGGLVGEAPNAEVWRFSNGAWVELPSARHPSGRREPAVAAGAASALLFGGAGAASGAVFDDTWRWADGWERVEVADRPPARRGHALVSHDQLGEFVLFGGRDAAVGLFGDTWTFRETANGGTWQQRAATGPEPRYAPAIAYDRARGVVVLFGGRSAAGWLDDTWEWNGSAWRLASPTSAPPARAHAALASHSGTGRLVLFGGEGPNGNLADTWLYDGVSWRRAVLRTGPVARRGHAMAASLDQLDVLLFGGEATTLRGDLWQWDGAGWRERRVAPGPGALTGHGLVRLPGQTLLIGGEHDGKLLQDTWILSEPVRND